METTIPHNFQVRPYQHELLKAIDNGVKRAIIVWHRRAGKDKTCFNLLVKKALERKGIYHYYFPTYTQAKKAVWTSIDKNSFRMLDHIPKEITKNKNSTDLSIELINGSVIQLIGTEKIDLVMGTPPVGCIFSEYSLQNPIVWDLIEPILIENNGWAIFNGTPRGENHFYDMFEMAKKNHKWFTSMQTIDDTVQEEGLPIVTKEQYNEMIQEGKDQAILKQEFYCSFRAGLRGAYYGEIIEELERQNRMTRGLYDPLLKVYTAWDLGMKDSTAIWFAQILGKEIRIIDYYESSGEGLLHYINYLNSKPYKYEMHILPHDAKVRELGTGKSRTETLEEYGVSNIKVLPALPLMDGIEFARLQLKSCWFDIEKCQVGIRVLKSYRKDYDEKRLVYSSSPIHDWSSHGADAFRMLCLGLPSTKLQNTNKDLEQEYKDYLR